MDLYHLHNTTMDSSFIRQKLRKVALQRSEEKRAYRCGLNVNIKDGNTVSAMEAES